MSLAMRFRRERTNVASRSSVTLTAPGNVSIPYGKGRVFVSGRGMAGNAAVPGNYANTNPTTPGTVANYNPAVPAAQKYNPPTGVNSVYVPMQQFGYNWYSSYDRANGVTEDSYGDWQGYEQPPSAYWVDGNVASFSMSNYEGTNPAYSYNNPGTPGNAIYNPTTPGYAAYNPDRGGNASYNPPLMYGRSYTDYYDLTNGWHAYSNNDHPWGPSNYKPAAYNYSANPGYPGNSRVTFNIDGYNPGNRYYNPVTPGNLYYNSPIPGNAVYNPAVPSTANYNPVIPGNANYNPTVPGNAGTPTTVLGVTFPGGSAGQQAPLVGEQLVAVPFGSLPLNVSYGGSITVTVK